MKILKPCEGKKRRPVWIAFHGKGSFDCPRNTWIPRMFSIAFFSILAGMIVVGCPLSSADLPLTSLSVNQFSCTVPLNGGTPFGTIVFNSIDDQAGFLFYLDFAATKPLDWAKLVSIPGHQITAAYLGGGAVTAEFSPPLNPLVDMAAYFDTTTVFYQKSDSGPYGPRVNNKFQIATQSIKISY